MTQGPEITGLAAWIVLMLPLAALVVVMVLALRGGGRRETSVPAGLPRGRYGAPLAGSKPRADSSPSAISNKSAPAAGARNLTTALEAVAAERDENAVADLHLATARQKLAAGDVAEAADQLRKAIRVASRIGKKSVHADARLELAEIARASGDLTTACEHWQMARGLFFEMKRAKELEKAEALMRQHGCPTDWVLNDF